MTSKCMITIDWRAPDNGIRLGKNQIAIRPVPARRLHHRCGSCRFMDRRIDGWECASWLRYLMTWFPTAVMKPITPQTRLAAVRSAAVRVSAANPGWFACPLWLSGESVSTRAWRSGHYSEFLTLRALAGELKDGESGLEFRTHDASRAQGDLAELERAGADMRRKTEWWKLLGPWNLPDSIGLAYSLGSALSAKAASSFEGLLSFVSTGYLTQSKGASVKVSRHINCRCSIIDDVDDELE